MPADPIWASSRIRSIVDTANGLRSDIVVLLGDYFATHRFVDPVVPHPVWAGELKRLRAPFGVWAILGNHDWWHGVEGVRKALADVEIPILENQVVPLGEEGNRFWLAGLGDQIAQRISHNHFRGVDDLPGTLAQVRTDDPIILLAHEPDIFTRVPDNVALTLAGHTHGGQIRVPFIWPALVPSAYGARYAYGHIVEDHRHMVVSGGLGTSIVPLRLGVPPEIVHVEVRGPSLTARERRLPHGHSSRCRGSVGGENVGHQLRIGRRVALLGRQHDNHRARLHPVVEIDGILIGHADAAG